MGAGPMVPEEKEEPALGAPIGIDPVRILLRPYALKTIVTGLS